jgi:hypothetical protein
LRQNVFRLGAPHRSVVREGPGNLKGLEVHDRLDVNEGLQRKHISEREVYSAVVYLHPFHVLRRNDR